MSRRVGRGMVLTVISAVVLAACEALLTEPAPASPDITVSFQITTTPLRGTEGAFGKVNRLALRFVRPDQSTRDTLLFAQPLNGRLRAGVALDAEERVSALGIQAELRRGPLPLFQGGAIARIEPGVPTSAQIPLQPVPARVLASQQTITLSLGQSVQFSSAVLYATGDTIENLAGTWTSTGPTIVAVSPTGLALAQGRGVADLIVAFQGLADTVRATVQ